MRPETLADLEAERDRLRVEEDAGKAWLRSHPHADPDYQKVKASTSLVRDMRMELSDLIFRWTPIVENEAKREPVMLGPSESEHPGENGTRRATDAQQTAQAGITAYLS